MQILIRCHLVLCCFFFLSRNLAAAAQQFMKKKIGRCKVWIIVRCLLGNQFFFFLQEVSTWMRARRSKTHFVIFSLAARVLFLSLWMVWPRKCVRRPDAIKETCALVVILGHASFYDHRKEKKGEHSLFFFFYCKHFFFIKTHWVKDLLLPILCPQFSVGENSDDDRKTVWHDV